MKTTFRITPAVLVAATLSACGGSSTQPQAFDGQELFQGIMLGSGPVSLALPELANVLGPEALASDAAGRERLHAAQGQLMGEITKLDPTFFEEFRQDVVSGEHLRIEAAMRKASLMTLRAALAMAPDPDDVLRKVDSALATGSASPAQVEEARAALRAALIGNLRVDPNLPPIVYYVYWVVYGAVVIDVAVAVNYAVVQFAAVAISLKVRVAASAPGATPKALRHEVVVDAIATRLAAPTQAAAGS